MNASVEVSEREWAVRRIRPAIEDVGSLELRRSTIRMRGVMKKIEPEV